MNADNDTNFDGSQPKRIRLYWVLLSIIGCLIVVIAWMGQRKAVQPFRKVVYTTNGVINKHWFCTHVTLPVGQNLLSIDLSDLQQQILQYSQIESVTLVREFPNTLRVSINERKPFARMVVIQKKKRAWGCVAEDGSVFLPIQQGSEVLKQCILLVDIPKTILKQQRIVGFAGIVQAIRCLQQVPELFLSVKSISLKHFDPYLARRWQTIELRMAGNWILVFPIDRPEEALNKAQMLLKSIAPEQWRTVRRVNMSLTAPTIEFSSFTKPK